MWTALLMLLGLVLPAAAFMLNAPGARSLAIVNRNRAAAAPCSMQCEKPCCNPSVRPDSKEGLDAAFLFDTQTDTATEDAVDTGIVDMDRKENDEEKTREGCCSCCPPGCACCESGCRCDGLN